MADKPAPPSSLPGYGLLFVAVAFLFGVAPARKDEEKKADAATGPAAPTANLATGDPKAADGYMRFLAEKKLLDGERAVPGTQFLILTLPDPVDSQLGYWYDQSIDALTRALSDLKEPYTLADRWFPWTIASEDRAKNLVVRVGSSKSEPGVMVYQRNNSAGERLVVLVVGENPLSGLNVPALRAALDLARGAPANAGKPIPLVGPFCTGSQVSLGRAVLEWVNLKGLSEETQVLTCVTGTALGLRPWAALWPEPEAKRLAAHCGTIRGTQAPFAQLRRVAMHYLIRKGRMDPSEPPDGPFDALTGRVAYLVEANSGFGEAAAAESRTGEPGTKGVVFRFPMHIGRLAGIRSKEARDRDQRLGLIPPGEGQLLATDATRAGGDLIPAADETRTALINQRLLTDYWAQIRRERIRYVWVVATDKRDVLFLLEQLRGACPDARPVVFGADLHYAHPDYLRFMRGVLVVGTYPLYPPAQLWQAGAGETRRLPFPSSNAEGVYNAVLAIRNEKTRMVDYRPPFAGTDGNPPVWVTTVGENGEFVPLGLSTAYDAGFLVPPDGASARDPVGTPFERPFFYLVGIVAIAAGFAAWRVWSVDRRTAPALKGADGRVWVPGLRAQYATFVGIGGVFIVVPLALTFWSAPAAEPTARVGFCASIAALTLLAAGTGWYVREQARLAGRGAAAAAPLPGYAILAPWQVVAFTLLVGGVVFGWLLADHSRLPDAARRLFAERASDLYTGCSPVVPAAVIALGFLGNGLMGLQHVRLMSEFRVAAPYPRWGARPPAEVSSPDAGAVGRIHAAVDEIDARFRSLLGVFTDPGHRTGTRWGRLVGWGSTATFAGLLVYVSILGGTVNDPILYGIALGVALLAVVSAVLILILVWRYEGRVPVAVPRPTGALLLAVGGAACAIALTRAQRTWESPGWNCLFATGLLALAFLTLGSGYRLFLLWKQVEKITRAIAVVPMVAAFDRFPDKVCRVFGAYLLTGRRRTLDLSIPLHLLARLRTAAEAAARTDPAAKTALKAVPKGPTAPGTGEEMEGASAGALCGVAAELVGALAPGWAQRPVTDAFGTVGAEPGKEEPPRDDWRSLAEQFVAIMAVIFLSQYFARMRCLAYMTIVPAGALLVAVTAYQFEPEQVLMYTAVGFAVAVISLLVWLLYRINKNELVSRATRGTPNKFQPDAAFVQNVAVFVLPLVLVVATQLAGRMRSVVEPVLGWLR